METNLDRDWNKLLNGEMTVEERRVFALERLNEGFADAEPELAEMLRTFWASTVALIDNDPALARLAWEPKHRVAFKALTSRADDPRFDWRNNASGLSTAVEKALAFVDAGASLTGAAKSAGISVQTVSNAWKRLGRPRLKPGRRGKAKKTKASQARPDPTNDFDLSEWREGRKR